MSKVPVGASIAHAYAFLFGRFFQIIGTAWVPALLYGLGYFVFLSAVPGPASASGPAALAAIAISMVVSLVFFLAIRSVLGISLTQEALGVRKDLTLAHFVIGPRELRLFFGYLRYYIVFIVLYAVVLAVSFGAMFLARKYGAGLLPATVVGGKPVAEIAALVFVVIVAIWFALSMIRLVFLLPPIASTEHRTRLSRAWTLTRGSTLRILFVLIGTFLPAAIAFGAVFYFVIGPADLSALVQAFHNAHPGNPPLHGFLAAHAPKLALLAGVFAAINAALLAGASATAYRAVTGHEDPELEDDAALVAPLLAPVEDHHEEPAEHGDHGHGGQEDHGHGGHENHGHGDHDDHGHGGHEDHGHGGHEDHGHGGHEETAAADDDDNQGHGEHEEHGHGGHDDHGHGGHEDHGHGAHDDHGHGHGDAHAGGHDDPGHGGGHDTHGDDGHGHDDHGHGHGDHGHGHHAQSGHDRAA
ncbi:MAG: hypothetical protein WDM86_15875 [Rhizomicrobium sp.]